MTGNRSQYKSAASNELSNRSRYEMWRIKKNLVTEVNINVTNKEEFGNRSRYKRANTRNNMVTEVDIKRANTGNNMVTEVDIKRDTSDS